MSQHLLDCLADIEQRVRSEDRIIVLLDFDGTLTPIIEDPFLAHMSGETREVLKTLHRSGKVTVGIISGRCCADVESRVGIEGLIYAGNHGLEIRGASFAFHEPRAAALRGDLQTLYRAFMTSLHHIAGVLVENKGLTISVHYRQVSETDLREVEHNVRGVMARWGHLFRLTNGLKVFEIRPQVNWHKGAAVRWIRNRTHSNALSMYIGDDVTDEDAFAALPDGITVQVGGLKDTLAAFHVAGPTEVYGFLRHVCEWVKEQEE